MTKAVSGLFGGGMGAQKRAMAEQKQAIEAERNRISAVEAGQRRVQRGGNGLRAYLDDQLKTTFGG